MWTPHPSILPLGLLQTPPLHGNRVLLLSNAEAAPLKPSFFMFILICFFFRTFSCVLCSAGRPSIARLRNGMLCSGNDNEEYGEDQILDVLQPKLNKK